jgi:cobalt-zinc-cadmium efflux system outer membrane protein
MPCSGRNRAHPAPPTAWCTALIGSLAWVGVLGTPHAQTVNPAPDTSQECVASPPPELVWSQAQQRLSACNRDVQVAVRAAQGVRADIRTAGQRPNPTLSTGVGQYSPSVGWGAGGLLDKQVDWLARWDQTLERGNKRELRVESARHASAAAQWGVADTLRQQQLNLAQAWIDLWGAQERVRLQREIAALYQRTLDAARLRLKAGDIAAAEVSRIDLDVQRAEGERIGARAELSRARSVVAALLALEGEAEVLTAATPWPRSNAAPAASVDPGSADRPDLQAARAQQSAAEARTRLARSLQTRDVSVGLQLERYAPQAGYGWLYGAYVSFPIFAFHRHEGEIACQRGPGLPPRRRFGPRTARCPASAAGAAARSTQCASGRRPCRRSQPRRDADRQCRRRPDLR